MMVPVSERPYLAHCSGDWNNPISQPKLSGPTPINGLADSKQLTLERREALYQRIVERALAWHVVSIEVDVIDRINILQATLVGMRKAVEGVMHAATELARIDGNTLPRGLPCPAEAWIGGDARDRSIMAASIIAKVTRDRAMVALHQQWPQYGFDVHKGYATPLHLAALALHGPCPIHRRSFAPVRAALGIVPDCERPARDAEPA